MESENTVNEDQNNTAKDSTPSPHANRDGVCKRSADEAAAAPVTDAAAALTIVVVDEGVREVTNVGVTTSVDVGCETVVETAVELDSAAEDDEGTSELTGTDVLGARLEETELLEATEALLLSLEGAAELPLEDAAVDDADDAVVDELKVLVIEMVVAMVLGGALATVEGTLGREVALGLGEDSEPDMSVKLEGRVSRLRRLPKCRVTYVKNVEYSE